MCVSWPQACIRPSSSDANGRSVSSGSGRPSMSARRRIVGPGPVPSIVATTELTPRPSDGSRPIARSSSATIAWVSGSWRPTSGIRCSRRRSSTTSGRAAWAASSKGCVGTGRARSSPRVCGIGAGRAVRRPARENRAAPVARRRDASTRSSLRKSRQAARPSPGSVGPGSLTMSVISVASAMPPTSGGSSERAASPNGEMSPAAVPFVAPIAGRLVRARSFPRSVSMMIATASSDSISRLSAVRPRSASTRAATPWSRCRAACLRETISAAAPVATSRPATMPQR